MTIEFIVDKNTIDTRFGSKPHPFSQYGVYQLTKNKKGDVVSRKNICFIQDHHNNPKGIGEAIIAAFNKSKIYPDL